MKPALSFKSSQRIEKLLTNLLAKAGEESLDSESGIVDIIYAFPESYDPLLKAIFENKYIAEHYDPETIAELLHHVYYISEPRTGAEYLRGFKEIFGRVKNDWLAVIPLDYNRPFGRSRTFRALTFGEYTITPPLRENRRFLDFFKKAGVVDVDEDSLRHQLSVTGGFLYSAPLLVFAVHGSRAVARENMHRNLRMFRQLHNLYTANFGERSTFISVHQKFNPINHGFLLDKKDGELERYPLRDGSQLLTQLNPAEIRHFIKKDFAALLSLMGRKTAGNRLKERMLRAQHFFSKGFNERDRLSRFLFYVISAEALFSRSSDSPISTTLADYAALVSARRTERLATHKRLKEIYGLRSKIVHSGHAYVTEADVTEAELIVARALLRCQRSLLLPTGIGSEDEFFQELMKLKLQLTSRLGIM